MSRTQDLLAASSEGALSEYLAEEIHRRILTGDIAVGSWLRQDTLAAEFNVSRTPVREAVRALGGRGVLEIIPRRGALVIGSTPRDIRENYEVRAELEGFAAKLAAERAQTTQLAAMRAAVDDFDGIVAAAAEPGAAERQGELEERWTDANERFHATLLEAADNAHLAASVRESRRRLPHNTTFAALSGSQRQLAANAADHRAILEAIEGSDSERARRLARQHLLRAAELVTRRFERELEAQQRRPR